MDLKSKKTVWAMATVALGIILAIGLNYRPVAAQGAAGSEPAMEDAYENIQALNGQPAHLMLPTMFYFEGALGVGCGYCHDGNNTQRALDTNVTKVVARRMINMVNAINQSNFDGEKQVTCFTCHQGQAIPDGVPAVINAEVPPKLEYTVAVPPPPPIPSVTANQIFDKYIAAMGGTSALQNVPSLTAAGTVTQRRPGRDFAAQRFEISAKTPAMKLTATGQKPEPGYLQRQQRLGPGRQRECPRPSSRGARCDQTRRCFQPSRTAEAAHRQPGGGPPGGGRQPRALRREGAHPEPPSRKAVLRERHRDAGSSGLLDRHALWPVSNADRLPRRPGRRREEGPVLVGDLSEPGS